MVASEFKEIVDALHKNIQVIDDVKKLNCTSRVELNKVIDTGDHIHLL